MAKIYLHSSTAIGFHFTCIFTHIIGKWHRGRKGVVGMESHILQSYQQALNHQTLPTTISGVMLVVVVTS